MHVVRSGDGDHVDLIGHSSEHFAVVREKLRVRVFLNGLCGPALVDIAEESDAVATGNFGDIASSFSAAADAATLSCLSALSFPNKMLGAKAAPVITAADLMKWRRVACCMVMTFFWLGFETLRDSKGSCMMRPARARGLFFKPLTHFFFTGS
jgi:hypothetical protein